ncbi:MAG: MmcQ/YjbR family DNA-binding protein [Rudaea sp.]
MTPDDFRKIALSLPEAVEIGHMGHPDFRVGEKIFATLGSPDIGHGMVQLMPDQQAMFMESHPAIFSPAKGKWGSGGSTLVNLAAAKSKVLREALILAWRLRAPPALAEKL